MDDVEHVVVAGGGQVGRRVGLHFADRGTGVTIVEPDERTADWTADSDLVEYVAGDATRPTVLRRALSEATSVLGALTGQEHTNMAICMAAGQLAPDIRTVARIENEDGDEYTEFVDDVYFPERASIQAAINAVSGSDVRTLEGVTGDLEVLDVRLDYDAPAAGEVVSDCLPEGTVVVAETDGHVAVQHSTTLVAGRRYLVAADQHLVDVVIRQFRGAVDE
jgi:trk system potassium uptake protein TrkA